MERYTGVQGKTRVEKIAAALEASGAKILVRPDGSTAPFEFRVRTPQGEDLDLVCYAFTANKYRQTGRPAGEHRMQVKYGSEFDRVHKLYIDPRGAKLTLMFGVHDELDLFIAVDPRMHTPTWFSSSIEFKEEMLERALESGWHGWERERTTEGRRRVSVLESFQTEVLIAFTSANFGRYLAFERVANGADPGERLLLFEKMGERLRAEKEGRAKEDPRDVGIPHLLETQFGLGAREILDVISGRFRLLTAVRGSIAEYHLERYLRKFPDLSDVVRLDEDGKPDFGVRFRGRTRQIRIECKNVLRRPPKEGTAVVDFQKTRASKNDPCSRYYSSTQFEILAACLHPVSEKWEYSFCSTKQLAPHRHCAGKLAVRVTVNEPPWTGDLAQLLEATL